MKTNSIIIAIIIIVCAHFIPKNVSAKEKEKELTNWETIDIAKYWKIKAKVPGAVSKSMKANPTFIQNFNITQSTMMVGTASSSRNESLFSGASLGGVSEKALQKLTNELYADLVQKLEKAGLTITTGDEVVNSEYAQKKKGDKKTVIQKTDGTTVKNKLNAMESANVREQLILWPENINVAYNYSTAKSGLFMQNLAKNTNTNILGVSYNINFADFDDQKGYKGKLYLTTKPGLYVRPTFYIINPKGAGASVMVTNGEIKGNNHWSKGIVEVNRKDGSWLGLSSSADYALNADEAIYIDELRALITNLQSTLINLLTADME